MAGHRLAIISLLSAQALAFGDASAILSYIEHQLTPEAIATDFKNYTESIAQLDLRCERNEKGLDQLELSYLDLAERMDNFSNAVELRLGELGHEMEVAGTNGLEHVESVENRTTLMEVEVERLKTQVKSILKDRRTATDREKGLSPAGLNGVGERTLDISDELHIVRVDGLLASGTACTTRDIGGVPSAEACLKRCDESGESGCRFALWNKLSTICSVVSPTGNMCSFSNHGDYIAIYRSKSTMEYISGDYRGDDITRDNAYVAAKVTKLQCRYACDLIRECNACGWWLSEKRCNVKTKNWNADPKTIDYVNHSDFVSWKVNK